MHHDKNGVDNQAKGLGREIKGKVNEVTGAVTGDTSQEVKGKVQKNVGKAQERLGEKQSDMRRGATSTTIATSSRPSSRASAGKRTAASPLFFAAQCRASGATLFPLW